MSNATSNDYMLTTIDNPYDPFTQWDEWLSFDIHAGHKTCEYLDRVCITSESLSDPVIEEDIHNAMKTIVNEDPIGIYIMVKPNMIKPA